MDSPASDTLNPQPSTESDFELETLETDWKPDSKMKKKGKLPTLLIQNRFVSVQFLS